MKNIKLTFIIGILLSVVTLSCKDNYEEDESFAQGSNFRIVNAATGNTTTPLKVYQDDKLLLDTFLYGADTNYFRTSAMNTNINFKTTSSDNVQNLVLNINEAVENNKSYTYFLVNPTVGSTKIEYVKTTDDVAQPDFDKVKVRVANLVSNLPSNVDLYIRSKNKVLVSNISFKKVSEFITIDRTDKIELVYTGTTNVVKAFNGNFVSKGVYTFVLGGNFTGDIPLTVNQFSNTL